MYMLDLRKEQSIDEWVFEVLAPVNEVIYNISNQVNNVIEEVLTYVC